MYIRHQWENRPINQEWIAPSPKLSLFFFCIACSVSVELWLCEVLLIKGKIKCQNRAWIISVNRKSALLKNLMKLTWRCSFLIDTENRYKTWQQEHYFMRLGTNMKNIDIQLPRRHISLQDLFILPILKINFKFNWTDLKILLLKNSLYRRSDWKYHA